MRTFLNALRVIALRFRTFGFQSGFTAARVFAINLYLKLANRVLPARVACPCCGWEGHGFRALDIGEAYIKDIECPNCRTHDRHRMLAVYFAGDGKALLDVPGTVLHVSPETYIRDVFQRAGLSRVVAVDITPEHLTHALNGGFVSDLQALSLADGSVQAIFCMHVLEHIQDDAAAIAELRRILAPGGHAVIMIPLDMSIPATDEWGAPHPQLFDHYRNYSYHDAAQRFSAFDLKTVRPEDVLDAEARKRYRIRDTEVVFLCRN